MKPFISGENDALNSLLVGTSQHMQELRTMIRRVAPSRLPVFITGPTGAGKELVANALHLASGRQGAFVAFNVCALADTMFEDALFGHARGAFTGAVGESSGYLAEANKGTIFLDEISGLALASQAKLLRAIESQTFRPVGAARDRQSEFRVLAASNEDLQALCRQGRFRLDLFHRLAGMTLHVPPLSSRKADIPALTDKFLRLLSGTYQITMDEDAMQLLVRAEWSGNVRQLKNVVELAHTLSDGPSIPVRAVRTALSMDGSSGQRVRFSDKERELLVVLEEAHWSVPIAATRLGVHRATIYRRLARLSGAQPTLRAD